MSITSIPATSRAGNLGLGVNVPVGSRFVFESTYNRRRVCTASPNLQFDQLQAGFGIALEEADIAPADR